MNTHKHTKFIGCLISFLAAFALAAGAQPSEHFYKHHYGARAMAVSNIFGCRGEGLLGRAVLMEERTDEGIKVVTVAMKLQGLPPGEHAVHIHQTAACEPCSAAGGHFDPGPSGETNPDGNHPFHSGDLINIHVKRNGRGKLKTVTTRVTLSPGPISLFDADGSAFIIHDNADTFCPEGAVAGCAGGSRAACGIIEPI